VRLGKALSPQVCESKRAFVAYEYPSGLRLSFGTTNKLIESELKLIESELELIGIELKLIESELKLIGSELKWKREKEEDRRQ
jgi:hypothetical protein